MRGFVVGLFRTYAGRWHQSQRPENATTLVAQNIAKHVFHHHHIETGRVETQVGGRCIDQNVFHLNIRIARTDFLDNLIPQDAGFEHVALVDIVEYFLAFAGELKRHFEDAPDLFFVLFQCFVNIASTLVIDSALFAAKIKSADQFTDNDQIYAITDHFGLEWGKMSQAAR